MVAYARCVEAKSLIQSLCYAKQPDWKFFEPIAGRLAALYLFGTPFGGLDHEELVHITKGSLNNRLIYDLMPDSHILRLMTDNFISDFVDHDVLIVSFYETQTTVVTKVGTFINSLATYVGRANFTIAV